MHFITSSIRWILKGRSSVAATVQTLLTRILIIGINVATGIITARTLGAEGRGEQAAMILWPQFLAFSMTLGLPSALLFNLKRYPEEKPRLFAAALLLGSLLGGLAAAIGVIFIPYWLTQYSTETIRVAQWFMLTAPSGLIWLILVAALESNSDFATANRMSYLAPLITLALLATLAGFGRLTPLTAGLAYLLPGFLPFFWTLNYLWQEIKPQWQHLRGAGQRLLGYGVRSYGVDLLGILSGQLDQIFVVGFLSPSAMGTYAVALSLSGMLSIFQRAVVVVLFPKASARPTSEVVALVGRAARVNTILTAMVGALLAFFGSELLVLLYGAEFVESVMLFRILILKVVLDGTILVLVQAFMALGKPEIATVLQAIGLGLSAPLLLWLIPLYGLVGAGLALLISTIARVLLVLISYPLILKVRPPGLLLKKADLRFLYQTVLERT
jgi:O-antigen/teichoic acid export membrane protein